MKLSRGAKVLAYYIATAIGLFIIIQGDLLPALLPTKLAAQVGNEGEAVMFAALMAATVQWVRPWASAKANPYLAVAPLALASVAFGIYLLYSDLPGRFATYSESFVAAGVLAFYVLVPRPFRQAIWLTPIVLAIIVLGYDTTFVIKQSEDLVMIMLAPITFDVVDRTILDPDAEERPRLRLAWCVSLVLAWLVFWQTADAMRPNISGPFENAVDYAHRANEAYWGLLIITLYFSYWLGKDWYGGLYSPGRHVQPAAAHHRAEEPRSS
jgi:hypothetical protein